MKRNKMKDGVESVDGIIPMTLFRSYGKIKKLSLSEGGEILGYAALIVFFAILGMAVFYSMVAYLLIRIISKKAFKRNLDRFQIIQIITLMAIVFSIIQSVRYQSWNMAFPALGLLIPLLSLNLSMRRRRESNKVD
ncbi:hypothetical protein [Paenibacillus pabuli]|uniref:hypothetical protein n=1 Tax=Paenibacillus pabuli TaxID=1472 RepID=UPI003CF8A4A9